MVLEVCPIFYLPTAPGCSFDCLERPEFISSDVPLSFFWESGPNCFRQLDWTFWTDITRLARWTTGRRLCIGRISRVSVCREIQSIIFPFDPSHCAKYHKWSRRKNWTVEIGNVESQWILVLRCSSANRQAEVSGSIWTPSSWIRSTDSDPQPQGLCQLLPYDSVNHVSLQTALLVPLIREHEVGTQVNIRGNGFHNQ